MNCFATTCWGGLQWKLGVALRPGNCMMQTAGRDSGAICHAKPWMLKPTISTVGKLW